MNWWHGINDTEDFILVSIMVICVLIMIAQACLAARQWLRRPQPIPRGQYTVVVRNVEECGVCDRLIPFNISERE